MARAKRTDRAEARRRYRAETGLVDDTDSALDDDAATATAPAGRRSNAQPMSSPPGRISIVGAFRQSIHPIDVRADLAALPWLATHSKALWLPVLITVIASVAYMVTGGSDILTAALFTYFVQTPAIGGVFLAGFLAPRASWLLGLIVGLVAALGFIANIFVAAYRVPGQDPATIQGAITASLVLSPIMGSIFAAGAAWYRRFLQLSNPNRGRRVEAKKSTGDGRSRSPKANARR